MAVQKHSAESGKKNAKRDMKKLSRVELLEMLLDVTRENDALRQENEKLQEQLNDRQIRLEESGSIAEAALRLNRIFEAAQEAADQYLENVKAKADGRSVEPDA